jgi:hypothetical protein
MWRRALKVLKCNISSKEALFIRTASYPINAIFPVKTGELINVLYLKRQRGLPFKKGVGSIIFIITLNLYTLLFFSITSFVLFGNFLFSITWGWFLVIVFLLLTILFFEPKKSYNFVFYFLRKIHTKFYDITKDLIEIFEKISFKRKIVLIFYSGVIVLLTLIDYYILFMALNLDVPLYSILFFTPLIILISRVPVTISGLGVRETLIILLFSRYTSPASLLAVGILISFIDYIFPALIGLFFIKSFLNRIISPSKKL